MFKKLIFDYARKSKKNSYGGLRSKKNIKAIVIHNTGNNKDTAKNNCDFFATGNTRNAGAHIFIDGTGLSARSIPLNRIAWSVGRVGYLKGSYFAMYNNQNTVSIELCDIMKHGVTDAQKKTLIKICKWLKTQCPNIENVVRHYDIVKKDCPHHYIENKGEWKLLRSELLKAINV